mmetsp:Transcript_13163/g.23871  ORF Transcript_13163/g.23871 Transcript_13163/m.23871 type:complete len:207 (-) Transcript_13163:741-1361(-)
MYGFSHRSKFCWKYLASLFRTVFFIFWLSAFGFWNDFPLGSAIKGGSYTECGELDVVRLDGSHDGLQDVLPIDPIGISNRSYPVMCVNHDFQMIFVEVGQEYAEWRSAIRDNFRTRPFDFGSDRVQNIRDFIRISIIETQGLSHLTTRQSRKIAHLLPLNRTIGNRLMDVVTSFQNCLHPPQLNDFARCTITKLDIITHVHFVAEV